MDRIRNRPNLFLEWAVVFTGFSIWIYSNLSNIPILLKSLEPKDLSPLITSNGECQFNLVGKMNGIFMDSLRDANKLDFSSSLFTLRLATIKEHLKNPQEISSFLVRQFSMTRVLTEVFLNNTFLLTAFATVFVFLVINNCVVARVSHFVKDIRKLEEIDSTLSVRTFKYLQHFTAETIIVLAYVIVESFASTSDTQPIFKDFASFVHSKFSELSKPVDSTIMAILFCINGGLKLLALVANFRLEKTFEYADDVSSMKSDSRMLVLSFTMFCTVMFSILNFIASAISCAIINPLYAFILVCESVKSMILVSQISFRINFLMEKIENEIGSRNRESLSTFLLSGGLKSRVYMILKIISNIVYHGICLAKYFTFMYIGLLINGKLGALLFTRSLVFHFRRFLDSALKDSINLINLYW